MKNQNYKAVNHHNKTFPLGNNYLEDYTKIFKNLFQNVKEEDIKDCIQEGVYKIYKNRGDINHSFFFVIIRNQIIDFIRKNNTNDLSYEDTVNKSLNVNFDIIEEKINHLKGINKEVFTKSFLEGWTNKKISKYYDINLNTIKSKIRKSKKEVICLLQKI